MVRKVRELGDFESSYEVPRIEGLKAPVEYERLAVEPQHFLQCFETFLKCADTPDFDCPKKAIKGWKSSRLRYLKERAREEQMSSSQTTELIEEDSLLNLLQNRSFVAQLSEIFEAFMRRRKTSRKTPAGRSRKTR